MIDRNDLLEKYKNGYEQFKSAIEKYPKEMWDFKPSENSWSIHEIIVHVADSEINGYVRCRKIIAENGAEVDTYDQDMWANELRYSEQSTDDYLQLLKILRKINYNLLVDTPEMIWATHTVSHPDHGNITLDDWLKIYTEHIDGHISQMKRVYEQWSKQSSDVS